MNLEELRIFINAIANRDQTGGAMSPNEYNSYLARANEDKFRIETGLRESKTPIYFQSNQTSTDALMPFIIDTQLNGVAGVFPLPNDYMHSLSMTCITNGKTKLITCVNADQFKQKNADPISPPSVNYPYATERIDNIYLEPNTINVVDFSYLRAPRVPYWAWTVGVDDEPLYDAANSIQMEWFEINHVDIARLILGYLGINFRDADLLQYAENIKTKGA